MKYENRLNNTQYQIPEPSPYRLPWYLAYAKKPKQEEKKYISTTQMIPIFEETNHKHQTILSKVERLATSRFKTSDSTNINWESYQIINTLYYMFIWLSCLTD